MNLLPNCLNHNDFVARTSYVYNLVMILKPYIAGFFVLLL